MAEALLGLEFDIHGGGIDLVFPHHENEAAQTLAGRGRELARLWMHNGMLEAAEGEKMAKSVGNIRGLAEVLDEVGPEPLLLHFATGHYRQPLAFSPDRLEAAANSVRRIREAGRRLKSGASPAELRPHRDAFFDALRDDFNTARALAALYEWVGEANKLPEGAGDDDLREMLGILGLERLLEADEGAPPEAQRAGGAAHGRAGGEGLGRGRPPPRRAARAGLGGPRWPAGTGARPGGLIAAATIDPAPRATIAPGGPGRRIVPLRRIVHRGGWSSTGATRFGRPCGGGGGCTGSGPPRAQGATGRVRRSRRATAEEIEARCGSDGHQGVCAEVDPYPYADAAELLAVPDAVIVALDEVTDPQNLGAVARTAEASGAAGIVIPERRSAEVTPAVCKASAGAVEHLPGRARAQPRRLPGRRQGRRRLVLRRRGGRAHAVHASRTTPARSSSSSAPRARGCARASPPHATTSSRSRSRGASNRSMSAPRRPSCCTGSCSHGLTCPHKRANSAGA